MLPKTNIAFVLLLALLALLAPKAGIEGDVDVPPAKPVVVADVAPNGDLLSPNVPLAAAPNARLVGFCVPKVLVVEGVPKVPLAGVEFVPNMGTDVFLSVEPNILVVPPKADVACDVPWCTLGVPNAGVVLLVLSKPGVIAAVETFPAMLNVDAVVPACVVELNNGDVALPNMPPAVPKDGESFVCPKIGVPLPNIKGAVVVEVKLALALANKLGLFVVDAVLVVVTKIEGTVVVGLLNIPVVPGTADAAPKND